LDEPGRGRELAVHFDRKKYCFYSKPLPRETSSSSRGRDAPSMWIWPRDLKSNVVKRTGAAIMPKAQTLSAILLDRNAGDEATPAPLADCLHPRCQAESLLPAHHHQPVCSPSGRRPRSVAPPVTSCVISRAPARRRAVHGKGALVASSGIEGTKPNLPFRLFGLPLLAPGAGSFRLGVPAKPSPGQSFCCARTEPHLDSIWWPRHSILPPHCISPEV